MANKYVQYGAMVAGATLLPAAAAGVGAAVSRASFIASNVDVVAGGAGAASWAASSVADAGTTAAGSMLSSTISNPAFLSTVGLGLVGVALGSGAVRPSLNFPNLAATAAVALSVSNLLQQGRAAAGAFAQTTGGLGVAEKIGPPVALRSPTLYDPNLEAETARTARQTYRLAYPNDLSDSYYIRFGMYNYERFDAANKTWGNALPHTTIRLPIPANLMDAISLAYQDVGLGQFVGAMFEDTLRAYGNSKETKAGMKAYDSLKSGAKGMVNDPDFMLAVGRRLASNVDPGFGTAIDIATGTAPNPHMTVTFQGVALKKYQFTWRFSPNNVRESKALEQIVRNLQAGSLPSKRGKFLLTFPNVIKVEMMPSNLFIFKPMMIDNVAVNYAPSGTPAFYKGEGDARYPAELELTISLRELDIHTAGDPDYVKIKEGQLMSDPSAG